MRTALVVPTYPPYSSPPAPNLEKGKLQSSQSSVDMGIYNIYQRRENVLLPSIAGKKKWTIGK